MGMMKDLFMESCDEIAEEIYGFLYYDLPETTQQVINEMATKRAEDKFADYCDYQYELWKERELHEKNAAEKKNTVKT